MKIQAPNHTTEILLEKPSGLEVSSKELSRRIKAVRKALKYKQEELGAIFGGGQPMISQWENGVIKDYKSALSGFTLLASYLADPTEFSLELERTVEPHSPILESPHQLSRFVGEIGRAYPEGEWDLVLRSGSYSQSKAPFKTSLVLQNEHRLKAADPSLSRFRVPSPQAGDLLSDAKTHGDAFVLHLQHRWSHPDVSDVWLGSPGRCGQLTSSNQWR